MPRFAVAVLALLTACSGGSSATTAASTTPSTMTTTTTATTEAPATTDTAPSQGLTAPELPDPLDLAEAPLEALTVPGFDFADVDPDLVEIARVRLNVFGGLYAASVWDELRSDDDEDVVAFSIYPAGSARGDPALARIVAEGIAEAGPTFDPPETTEVAGRAAYRVSEDRVTWLVWANNTHLFIAAGGGEPAPRTVMEAIIAETDGSEYQWSAGDCLYFDDGVPYAPFGTGNVVDCRGAHEWEITRSEPLPDGSDDPFPGEDLNERIGAACEEAFFEFTGVLPLDSALNQIFYLPDEAEWSEGDRYFACLVSRNDGSGGARLIEGSLEGESDVVERAIGDCHRRVVDIGMVDCGSPHVFEFVGMAAYPGDDDDGYPGGVELDEAFEEACQGLIDAYVSEAVVEGATVTPFPLGFGPFAWGRGVRESPCYAYAVDDGVALEVVGSFSGGWGPLGEADRAVQA